MYDSVNRLHICYLCIYECPSLSLLVVPPLTSPPLISFKQNYSSLDDCHVNGYIYRPELSWSEYQHWPYMVWIVMALPPFIIQGKLLPLPFSPPSFFLLLVSPHFSAPGNQWQCSNFLRLLNVSRSSTLQSFLPRHKTLVTVLSLIFTVTTDILSAWLLYLTWLHNFKKRKEKK